jgi:hypothetical protein
LAVTEENEYVGLQILIRPLEDGWQDAGYSYIDELKGGKKAGIFSSIGKALGKGFSDLVFGPSSDEGSKSSASEKVELSNVEELSINSIQEKLLKMGYLVEIKVLYSLKPEKVPDKYFQSNLATFKQYSINHLNGFVQGEYASKGLEAIENYKSRHIYTKGFVLNTEELAGVVHFPGGFVATPNINRAQSKKGEPPLNLPVEGDITYFGTTNFRNKKVKFGVKNDTGDRLRHMYFVGKTGGQG